MNGLFLADVLLLRKAAQAPRAYLENTLTPFTLVKGVTPGWISLLLVWL